MRLMIQCPDTGKLVFTSVDMDKHSWDLCDFDNATASTYCHFCGKDHVWKKSDVIFEEELR